MRFAKSIGRPSIGFVLAGCRNRPFYLICVLPDRTLGRHYRGSAIEQVYFNLNSLFFLLIILIILNLLILFFLIFFNDFLHYTSFFKIKISKWILFISFSYLYTMVVFLESYFRSFIRSPSLNIFD